LAERVRTRLTPAEGRRFAFPVAAAFLLLAGLFAWRGHGAAMLVSGSAGALLGLAGLIAPGALGPVHRAWMGFALVLSRVTTPIFMGVVFFLVITPTALVMRLLGRDPLARAEAEGGLWVRRPEGPGRRSDLERQF
jgi:hypothetical protein